MKNETSVTITIKQTIRGWDIDQKDEAGNIYPTTSYPNSVLAAARVLQLMEIPISVAPQSHPERIFIGEVDDDMG